MKSQWWLAEVDQYGNPTLIDGAHNDIDGVRRALEIFKIFRLEGDRRFVACEVIIHCVDGDDT